MIALDMPSGRTGGPMDPGAAHDPSPMLPQDVEQHRCPAVAQGHTSLCTQRYETDAANKVLFHRTLQA